MRLVFMRVCVRVCAAARCRYRVEPARVPGMTARESLQREDAATEHAEAQQSLQCVL